MSTIIPITLEEEWLTCLNTLPTFTPPMMGTLVLSPHPDDETLGAGGLINHLRRKSIPVEIVAITNGERAYPNFAELGTLRIQEQNQAASFLGVDEENIHRLNFPDSGVSDFRGSLEFSLEKLIDSHTHVIAPWIGDFHPDHEIVGEVAKEVAFRKKARISYYFFWMWHRGTPDLLKSLNLSSFPLSAEENTAKRLAIESHQSQLSHPSQEPILPEYLLHPLYRPFEVYVH